MPTRYVEPDEFAAWCSNPITRWFLKGVELMAEEERTDTMRKFFECDGLVAPHNVWQIHYNRGAFDAYSSVASITLSELTRVHNGEDDER